MMSPTRDICGRPLQSIKQIFSKDSLYLEKICCKSSRTFGEKSPIVSNIEYLSIHPHTLYYRRKKNKLNPNSTPEYIGINLLYGTV